MHHKPKTIFFTLEIIPFEIIEASPLNRGLAFFVVSIFNYGLPGQKVVSLPTEPCFSIKKQQQSIGIVAVVLYRIINIYRRFLLDFDFLVFALAVALLFLDFDLEYFFDFFDLDFEYFDFFAFDL